MPTSIAIVCTKLNALKNCYITQIILFNIDHLCAHSELFLRIAHVDSFICTLLNVFKNCYSMLISLFNTVYSFAYSKMVPSIPI